ncbi:hypothetical protein ACS0TY_023709 [Phlomoides rotata]
MSVLTLFTITTACSLCDSFHMDFGHLGFDNFLCSTSALENAAEISKQKCYGFGFQRQERAVNEEERDFKMAKTNNNNGSEEEGHQQMLCFSSQPVNSPYYPHTASPFGGGNMGGRAPFTESQWMELEHQALIYKYITANVPIPSYLLNPIRKALESAGFPALRSNSLGWGGFQLGSDPESGRCRRTDGKKWRCSRDAVAEKKYCDRHMNRGRHRSRKPVEPQPPNTTTLLPSHPASPFPRSVEDANGGYQHTTLVSITSPKAGVKDKHHNSSQESSSFFGLVNSDSLLNPLNSSSSLINCPPSDNSNNKSLRHFIDDWPKTHLSISIPTSDWELSVGRIPEDQNPRQSWEPSMGGPLGEVLHNSAAAGECNLCPSPTGVLQRGAFGSLSNSSTASSPRSETLVMNASLPAPLN